VPAALGAKYGVRACERTSSGMASPSSATTISTNPRARQRNVRRSAPRR
jgi:hypothetical protein